MIEKVCSKCSVSKPRPEFNKDCTTTTGMRARCRQCELEDRRSDVYREKSRRRHLEYRERNHKEILQSESEYRERNREKIKEQARKHAESNRERIRKRAREYRKRDLEKALKREAGRRKRNRERIKTQQRAYVERHPERVAASQRRYMELHPERVAASVCKYRERNHEKILVRHREYKRELKNPEDVIARLKKAERLMEEGKWQEAVRILGPAIRGLENRGTLSYVRQRLA